MVGQETDEHKKKGDEGCEIVKEEVKRMKGQ